MTTNELLRRYVADRSDAAFAELVSQHINLVYSAALRQVNGDCAAAQDVTQAVFTDLARKAPALTRHASLTGWLYTSTRYLAANARRAENRRRDHEQEAYAMNLLLQSAQFDPGWQELRPLLDEAMHQLSPADREAVLLRYFEHLPLAQVGAKLGLSENTARKRVDRAIEKLRAIFAKRGITSSVTALAALLTDRAVAAAPAGLAGRISVAAVASAATGSALGWALLKLAAFVNVKTVAAASAAILLMGVAVAPKLLPAGTWLSSSTVRASSQAQPADSAPSAAAGVAGAANATTEPVSKTNNNQLVLRLVADDSGKPISGGTIEFFVGEQGQHGSMAPNQVAANDQGICIVPFVRDTLGLLMFRTRNDGFVDTSYSWSPARGESIPREYTARLPQAVQIGGQVVNEENQPVSGAEVKVQVASAPTDGNSPPPHISTAAGEKTITDANGRWRINRFAKDDIPQMSFQANHPDYASNLMFNFGAAGSLSLAAQWLAGTNVYVLDRGITVRGTVVDPDGQPVAGARVALLGGRRRETSSLSDGTFTLTGCKIGACAIQAEARGLAAATLQLTLTNDQAPLVLSLNPAKLLRLRVVDANGSSVTNYSVTVNNYNVAVPLAGGSGVFVGSAVGRIAGRGFGVGGPNSLVSKVDSDGRMTWDSAPEGDLALTVEAYGYQSALNLHLQADGTEHQIILHPARVVSGAVLDAATSQPISCFRVAVGRVDGPELQWFISQTYRDGTFRLDADGMRTPVQFKFEADGYASSISRVLGMDEGAVTLEIVLQPATATTLTVLKPDGRPATNADIGLEMPGTRLQWTPGGLVHTQRGNYTNVFSTDNTGRFVLPPDDSVTRVIAASPDGYGEATPAGLATSPVMQLQPWGRIEGTYLSDGKPAVGRVLTFATVTYTGSTNYRYATQNRFSTQRLETDASGHFVFAKVPPGQITLLQPVLRGALGPTRSVGIPELTVRLGATTTVSLDFYTVTARLSLPPGVEMKTNWYISAVASKPSPADERPTGASLNKSSDGSWVAENLAAGTYTLYASVVERAANDSARSGPLKIHLRTNVSFTLPADSPSGLLDLGEIVLRPVQ